MDPRAEKINHTVMLATHVTGGKEDFFMYQNNYGTEFGRNGYGRLQVKDFGIYSPILNPLGQLFK